MIKAYTNNFFLLYIYISYFKCERYEIDLKKKHLRCRSRYTETGGSTGNDSRLSTLYLVGVITVDAKREPNRTGEKKVLNAIGNQLVQQGHRVKIVESNGNRFGYCLENGVTRIPNESMNVCFSVSLRRTITLLTPLHYLTFGTSRLCGNITTINTRVTLDRHG